MTDTEKLQQIEELLKNRPTCLCGTFEHCEICNPYSPLNVVLDRINNILHPKPPMTLEDYGQVVKFRL